MKLLSRRTTGRAVLPGLVAGALGGAAGWMAKVVGEVVYPPRTWGQVPPPVLLAERLAGRPLTPGEQEHRMQVIHWILG